MAFTTRSQDSEPTTPSGKATRDYNNTEDHDGTLGTVAICVEQLRKTTSSQKQLSELKLLLELINTRENACSAVTAHSQAVPTLVSLLRKGSTDVRTHAATILGSLCRDEESRVKVLLGGCVIPLLDLLKSGSKAGQLAAAEAIHSVSKGSNKDNVGSKIFITTEGVVPTLWELLKPGSKLAKSVGGLITGALRNLCGKTEGFWSTTIGAGGVDIMVNLIKQGNPIAQANTCFILARMTEFKKSVCSEVLSTGIIENLLKLLEKGSEVMVRAGAASALKALSAYSEDVQYAITEAEGVPRLINATIAPSKEFMHGEYAQTLQENAMFALANISGGLTKVIDSLCETLESCEGEDQIADHIGAIASALMIYDSCVEIRKAADPSKIEGVLIKEMKSGLPFLVQERIIEALASLYGNSYLCNKLPNGQAKRLLVGLITMATDEVQNELIGYLKTLCNDSDSLLYALEDRQGIQLLISLLGLSSEQQQECAVALLCMLANENDKSKWYITAAGGIPPLVQLLEGGSSKAKEDAATLLGNLCNHSDDIRKCVQSADAVPSLLWLLKSGSPSGKELAARTLNLLIHNSDTSTISQLTALLTSDMPESKSHIMEALKSLLSITPLSEILLQGSATNDAMEAIIKILRSFNEEACAKATSVLAYLFDCRQDLRESSFAVRCIGPVKQLLSSASEHTITKATGCLAAIFKSIRHNQETAKVARETLRQLISFAKSSVIAIAEQGTKALANALLDPELTTMVSIDDVVAPATRILRIGSIDAKTHAAAAVSRFLQAQQFGECRCEAIERSETVMALVSLIESGTVEDDATSEALHALASISKIKGSVGNNQNPLAGLSDGPQSLGPLVSCLVATSHVTQESAIEVVSKLCRGQSFVVGEMIASSSGCIIAIAEQVITSRRNEVRVGGIVLLICAAKEDKQKTMEAFHESNLYLDLIHSVVEMIGFDSISWITKAKPESSCGSSFQNCGADMLGGRVAVWLLSLIASYDSDSKLAIMDAGAIEVLTDRLSGFPSPFSQVNLEDDSEWVCVLLLAILFQHKEVCRASATTHAIPVLATLLKCEDIAVRYFSAQGLASVICNGSRGALLAVANSGAIGGLIQLLGYDEASLSNLAECANVFSLVQNPEEVALEWLFKVDDIRFSAASRNAIPMLVDSVKTIQERPGDPSCAVRFMTQLVSDNDMNRIVMADAGAVSVLTRLLSPGTQNNMDEEITDLLRILFASPEIGRPDSAADAVNQLVGVLQMGTNVSRYNAARALEGLFGAEHYRVGEAASQAIQPLVELVSTGSEKEQAAVIGALIKLLFENPSVALAVVDVETDAVDVMCQIISSDCCIELKEDAAELCSVLFRNSRVRTSEAAVGCVESLLSIISSDELTRVHFAAVRAIDKVLDDQQLVDFIAEQGAIELFIGLLVGGNFLLHEAVVNCLIKLAKDRPVCKVEMTKAGVIDNILEIFQEAPDNLCTVSSELLRILTNNQTIVEGGFAAKVVRPLFSALYRLDLSYAGQYSAMRVLINILEDSQRRASYSLTPSESVEPLVPLLYAQSQPVHQAAAELLSLLFMEDDLQSDIAAEQAIHALVQMAGSGVLSLQNRAIKALVRLSLSYPSTIAEAGGVPELSKVIMQVEPPLSHAIWESTASVLSSILQFSSQYHSEVPVAVLVRMLCSASETTIVSSLNALLVLEADDKSSDIAMAESGAIEALLMLLRIHVCEEAAARLLEALLNNVKIREMKVVRTAIAPLSQYLLDPQTQLHQAILLAALALGDLFQNEALTRTSDAISACRAFVNLLEDQPTDEMKVVAICALQNLVMYSRPNRKAVAEAGGVQIILALIGSSSSDIASQAAVFTRLLFSNHTIQDYASAETLRSLTAVIEKNLDATGTVNEEFLKTLNTFFTNFPRLRGTEPASSCISQLVAALKAGPEATQEVALDSLCLLKHGWSAWPADVARGQAIAAAKSIPILQHILQAGPPRFQDRAEHLLQFLPGRLLVTIKKGENFKQIVGNPSVYCKITLGNTPTRQTKVVSTGPNPEFDETFAWDFDIPPKGVKLHVSCKNKSTLGKVKNTFGKVNIQIDRVVLFGSVAGVYSLQPEKNKGGQPRNLEIEFSWTTKINVEEDQ